MQIFKFSRAANAAQAIQAAAVADTAQQGAQVRFIAGGTTLVDLMKLGCFSPIAQHGNDGRKSTSAHSMHVLSQRCHALQ
jgi:hypothetical protein